MELIKKADIQVQMCSLVFLIGVIIVLLGISSNYMTGLLCVAYSAFLSYFIFHQVNPE